MMVLAASDVGSLLVLQNTTKSEEYFLIETQFYHL